jgi:hypothetical protein
MSYYGVNVAEELPAYDRYTTRLRSKEAQATSRALIIAAVFCVLRAAIVPWYIHFTYSPRELVTGPNDVDIVVSSVVCMVMFVLCALWSRFAPLVAALIALTAFLGLGVRDYMAYEDITQGILYKISTSIVLLRGFMNAIMSRTL